MGQKEIPICKIDFKMIWTINCLTILDQIKILTI